MRLLSIAARDGGYVAVDGVKCTVGDIARLVGHPAKEVATLLAELEQHHVFSRDRSGKIYNRRMIRDEKQRKINQKNGQMGGNPTLLNQRGKSQSDNPPDNGHDNTPIKSRARAFPLPYTSLPTTLTQTHSLKGEAKEGSTFFKNLKGDLGPSAREARSAPSPAANPQAEPLTDAEKAQIDEMFTHAVMTLTGEIPKATQPIRAPQQYHAAIANTKYRNLVHAVHDWASGNLNGEQRWAAWEVIAVAEKAAKRSAMSVPERKAFDALVALYRQSSPNGHDKAATEP